MAGRVFAWLYFAGYALYVGAAGVTTWPMLPFGQWWTYMAWQAGFYGPLWPLFIGLNLLGVRW